MLVSGPPLTGMGGFPRWGRRPLSARIRPVLPSSISACVRLRPGEGAAEGGAWGAGMQGS